MSLKLNCAVHAAAAVLGTLDHVGAESGAVVRLRRG